MLKLRSFLRTRTGILIGLLLSLLSGFIYLRVLRGPGSQFYLFAGLAFLLGPLVAGTVDAVRSPAHKFRTFLASGGVVFGTAFLLFILIYAILIRLFTTSVDLPAYCDGTYPQGDPQASLAYVLPDQTKGILVNADKDMAVVATIDYEHAPHASTLYLIDKPSGNVFLRVDFPDDNIAVALDDSTVYLFNTGIGFFVNKSTMKPEDYFLTMDAYGTNDRGYFETTGIISSWSRHGAVKSMLHLSFNGILRGCYISGVSGQVIRLR